MDSGSSTSDVTIVGGSYAGLSAALQLARTRRPIVVVDGGVRRNRFAHESHGLIGQDGRDPAAIAAAARADLMKYPSLRWIDGLALEAAVSGDGFTVGLDNDERLATRRIVLAPGVIDTLPKIEGLAARWGTSVFHCPYCHGYELNRGRLGVIAAGPHSYHQAVLLPEWGQVTLFTNGVFTPDAAQHADLERRGVIIETAPVARVVDTATIALEDGRQFVFDGLFTATHTHVATPLPQQLGCALEESPLGSFIRTDALKATTVPGVFACGDAARGAGTVALAVGDGAQAGLSAHRSLVFGTWTVD